MRALVFAPVALLALAACGEADIASAGRNAAWAAVEAADPQLAVGLRAAQALQAAATTCGWEDVNAAALAQAGLATIEEPMVRAAAASLVEDLIVESATAPAQAAAASDCSPEARQALEQQIAAMTQGEGGEGADAGEAEAEAGG
jgi:hypothetical protein